MKSQRNVCFLIDEGVLNHHHGVRRLVFSLIWNLVSQGENVDLLCHGGRDKSYKWSRVELSKDDLLNNGFSANTLLSESREGVLAQLKRRNTDHIFFRPNIAQQFELTKVDVSGLEYDDCVFSAPWVFKRDLTLPSAKNLYCIALDAIPNRYYFADPRNHGLRAFANEYAEGFRWADEEANGILCISEDTKIQCEHFGFGRKNGLRILPPILPPGFEGVPREAIESPRGNVAILAAPFDRRKGMQVMPGLINSGDFEQLLIFGRPRCRLEELVSFFDQLEIENIEWWLDVDFNTQSRLYMRSKVLIFPSLNEGLGLPLLEAYACGASALVSDISPLNSLALPGDVLPKEEEAAKACVKSRGTSMPDPYLYRNYALDQWSGASLRSIFEV